MLSDGNGITTDKINLQEPVDTIAKLSSNRVLPFYEKETQGDIQKILIPVTRYNNSDKKDTALRRYLSDWLKRNVKDISVDTRFEKMNTFYHDGEGNEHYIVGALSIAWWPRPPDDSIESWRKKRQEARKES